MADQFVRMYDYGDAPTIKQFNQDKRFFRCIMGPYGCVPANTQFLSPHGWKNISEYSGEKVAQWDRDKNAISFVTPDEYIKLPCDSFIRFDSGSLVMELSGEHRVPYYDWNGKFQVKTAAQIANKPFEGIIPTVFAGHKEDALDMSDDLIRLAVVMHADGHYIKASNKASICVHKERKKNRIRQLLASLGIEYVEKKAKDRPTEVSFYFVSPYRGKYFTGKWWSASRRELAIIIDECLRWNGWTQDPDGCAETKYFSAYKENAEFIQYAAHTTGRRAIVGEYVSEYPEKWKQAYYVQIFSWESYKNYATINCDTTKISTVSSVDGNKYCFAVQSGFFVARCEGTIFITGNSGKSSGCVAEIIDVGISQAPDQNRVRRTRWAVVRSCYDDITEILTERRGWQLFKDLLPEDKVAMLDGDTLTFTKPTYYFQADYNGEMIGFQNEGIDFCVTPDHKMYVSMRNAGKKIWQDYCFRTAEDVYGNKNMAVKRNAGKWQGSVPSYSVAFCEWLGFWTAEGYASLNCHGGHERRKCVITNKNDQDYVRKLFIDAEIPFGESKRKDGGVNFVVRINEQTKPIIDMLIPLSGSGNKHVLQWLKDSPPEYIKAFIKGYLAGDGSRCNNGTIAATTASKQLADDIQELALRAGMVVNVTKSLKRGAMVTSGVDTKQKCDIYRMVFLTEHKYEPMLTVGGYAKKYSGWYRKQYSGKVYCVEVPTHVVYVRRNRKAFWCSQTYRQLLDTTMETFFHWLPPERFGVYNVTNYTYNINKIAFDDGTKVDIEIIFRALDKPEHVRNLLSLELTGAWFNEIRETPKIIVDNMEGRVNRFPSKIDGGATWAGIIADTNPPDTDSWLYKFFEEKVAKDPELQRKYVLFKQPSGRSDQAENRKYLPDNYYTNMAIGKDPEFIKVYIDGEYGYIRDGKPVFANYVDSIHCAEETIMPIKGLPVIIGLDFGLSPAAVICQYLPKGQFNVIHEFTSEEMGIRRFFNEIIKPYVFANLRGYEIVIGGDPAGVRRQDTDERSCFDELRMLGYPATPAHTNSFLARYNAVDAFLTKTIEGKPAFQVSPSCAMLRKGFNGEYKLKKYRGLDEKFSEVPVKNEYSHVHDALQYACMIVDRALIVEKTRNPQSLRYSKNPDRSKRATLAAWT